MIDGKIIVDNFAGGGGASTGIEMATGITLNNLKLISEIARMKRERLNEKRIHPTQKPVNLYRWILQKYKIPSDWKILDTHVGSASSLIAFHENGNKFVGFEKDKYMYDLSMNRYNVETAQIRLIDLA